MFVRENKSLTAAEEFWEVKSQIAVGDEEYTYLQNLLKGCFRWGISLECQLLSGFTACVYDIPLSGRF